MSIQQRRERERAHRHQLIVDTARALAEAEGWDAVTTRRLAEQIEYSQPVLYSHFANKDAIVAAVAVEGFAKLRDLLRDRRDPALDPRRTFHTIAWTYVEFAEANPALYDAMFLQASDLPFARPDAPSPLHEAFEEVRQVLAPLAGSHDPGTFAEVVWSALHGLVTLTRDGRIPPDDQPQRITLLVDQLVAAGAAPKT